jgi:uncharacterized protein
MPTTRAYSRIAVQPFEVKGLSRDSHTFTAIASTPQLDRQGEVVSTDAMREAAGRYMQNPVVAWQHFSDMPIGRATDVQIVGGKTELTVYLTQGTEAGREAWALVEDGIVRSMSIGFTPYSRSYGAHPDGTPDFEVAGDLLTWKRIDWLETSLVSIPANPGAVVTLAKGLGCETDWPEVASPEETEADAEEKRFFEDLQRATGGAESVVNIARHWTKEGRVLAQEHVDALVVARDKFCALLEPYLVTPDETRAEGALSLPTPPATPLLHLPSRPLLHL